MIAGFYKVHPDIQANMLELADFYRIYEHILDDQAELAFITMNMIMGTELFRLPAQIVFTPLWDSRFLCLIPAAWLFAASDTVTMADLEGYPMIVTENAASKNFNALLITTFDFHGKIIIWFQKRF